MKVLIAGDYCDNARVSQVIKEKNYSALFGEVKDLISHYDFRLVNFEFPIVQEKGRPINKCGPVLKGQIKAIDAINYAGFNVCTLANNHILDQGEECLLNTKRLLEGIGIKTVGAGSDLSDASKVLYLDHDSERVAVINCCEHEFSIASNNRPGTNPLNVVAQYRAISDAKKKCDYVLVIIHGGIEHYQYPTPRMVDLYRFFIDVGADAVINHHQHCYCGYEVYKGKPIFYGLGNFLFDWEGKRHTLWNQGILAGITFSKGVNPELSIIPFNQCNDTPSVSLMSDSEKEQFVEESERISQIIQDEFLLAQVFSMHIESLKKEYRLLIEPFNNRLTKGLFNRGLLPSVVSNEKLTKVYNYINCESHQEVFLSVLKALLSENK